MDKYELDAYICEIVDLSFKRLNEIYKANKDRRTSSVSRLVFPHYRKSKALRISEQELRFVFVEVFNQYCDEKGLNLFYSIETPSNDAYNFSGVPRRSDSDSDHSAMFDLVVFDEDYNRRALIEFKANNAGYKSHKKDLVKLSNRNEGPADVLRYFIEIIDNCDGGTINSLRMKLSEVDSDVQIEKLIYSLRKEDYIIIWKSQFITGRTR